MQKKIFSNFPFLEKKNQKKGLTNSQGCDIINTESERATKRATKKFKKVIKKA